MQMEGWMLAVATFVASQIGSLIWVLAAQRGEGRVVRKEIQNVRDNVLDLKNDMQRLENVLVAMADMRGELNVINERMLAQGQRLDEEISRTTSFREKWWDKWDDMMSKANA